LGHRRTAGVVPCATAAPHGLRVFRRRLPDAVTARVHGERAIGQRDVAPVVSQRAFCASDRSSLAVRPRAASGHRRCPRRWFRLRWPLGSPCSSSGYT
jgi:hypothetical protein